MRQTRIYQEKRLSFLLFLGSFFLLCCLFFLSHFGSTFLSNFSAKNFKRNLNYFNRIRLSFFCFRPFVLKNILKNIFLYLIIYQYDIYAIEKFIFFAVDNFFSKIFFQKELKHKIIPQPEKNISK